MYILFSFIQHKYIQIGGCRCFLSRLRFHASNSGFRSVSQNSVTNRDDQQKADSRKKNKKKAWIIKFGLSDLAFSFNNVKKRIHHYFFRMLSM